jgi:hypothetical protein
VSSVNASEAPVIAALRELARTDPMVMWGVLREDPAEDSARSIDAYCEWPARDLYCEIHSNLAHDAVRVILDTFTIDGVPVNALLSLLVGISRGAVKYSTGRFTGRRVVVTGIDNREWIGL